MKSFTDMVEEALVRASEYGESRFLADGEIAPGVWKHYASCEEGHTPDILLEASPEGWMRLIENRAVPYDTVVEALRRILKAREVVMRVAGTNSILFDGAQEDLQEAIKEAQALLYKLPDPT